jgi:protocatechuate 3,4-dioxygenase beta subunit
MTPDEQDDRHDRGLQYDLGTLRWQRRRVIQMVSGMALVALVGCSTKESPSGARTSTPSGSTSALPTLSVTPIPTGVTPASACIVLPRETEGPFPGNGSNGPNALLQSGILRRDIRSSVGTSTTKAEGVPLSVQLTIVDTRNGCRPIVGAAVYAWHCDREGRYSMYSPGATNENYLRGVQEADANGLVHFDTIVPAAYSGRWPHIHFEVYPTLAKASSSANKLGTSQLALPEAESNAVYATPGYEQSVANMRRTPLSRDTVFSDGVSAQMATLTGNVKDGYQATLVVGL